MAVYWHCHHCWVKTRPYWPKDWLLWMLPPVVITSKKHTICHLNYVPVPLLSFQIHSEACLFAVELKKKTPQCCLLFSLVQKALGAVRSLTPTSSPLSSPSKHGDRFIPSRAGANWSVNFHRINVSLPQQQIHQALFCLSYQKNNALKIKVFALFFLILKFTELVESDHLLIMIILTQEIEKSHNQNRKTKDGTTDSNKGNPLLFSWMMTNCVSTCTSLVTSI